MRPNGPVPACPPSLRPASWLRALAVGAALVAAPAPLLAEQQPDDADGVAAHTAHRPRRFPILERARLLDDWGGVRSALDEAGVQLDIGYDHEVLGNPSGGLRQGAVYQGVWEFDLDIDVGKALGWTGLTAHATAYQIHGRGLTASRLGNLLTVSDIEATPATRLSTLFVEQALVGGLVTVRAGQLAVDDEFLISEYAIPLANATFGWPAIVGVDLPSGGPAYPLGTPGIRGRLGGADGFSVMAAVFNGDPVGRGAGDPQRRDPSGTAFRIGDDALAIMEIAYGVSEQRRRSGLAGTYKLGGWYHGGRFDDQRFDAAGLSLADPASSGQPATRRGNFGLYAVIDQMVWRHPTRHGAWVGAFLRIAGSPEDRNLIGAYIDGGVTANGLVPGREYDVVSLGAAVARISRDARRLDRDTRAFAATDAPLRDAEALIELTYQVHIAPWLIVEPDLQYVIHPGGHAADPAGTGAIPDALVAGLRTVVRF